MNYVPKMNRRSFLATAAAAGFLHAAVKLCALLVEHIERRQADVRNLLVTEEDLMIWNGVLRRNIRRRSASRCGRSAR